MDTRGKERNLSFLLEKKRRGCTGTSSRITGLKTKEEGIGCTVAKKLVHNA